MRNILYIIVLTLFTAQAFAQKGRITGKITNNRNEVLSGVIVKAEGVGATQTNGQGFYTITIPASKKIDFTVSYVGYKTKVIADIEVKANDEEVVDILLEEDSKNLDAVTVKSSGRATGKGETVNAMIAFQKNTNTVASVISAETIKRSPDRNTSEVLKRTSGASIQDGKFLVIRGLADRYNASTLNGVLLGSTEPDRKTFSFDIIPSSMIDNVIINKAFVPELPGEWAGGLVQINTRDIPSKNFFNIQIGTGFNTQTHFNDFFSYKKGKTDWLGIDDGTRSLPASYTTKGQFDILSTVQKTAMGAQFANNWQPFTTEALPNMQLQMSGGFTAKLKGQQQLGGIFGVSYSRNVRRQVLTNNTFNFLNNGTFTLGDADLDDNKYTDEVSLGALGNVSYQLNSYNKFSIKTLVNVNGGSFTNVRTGNENFFNPQLDNVRGFELGFSQNTFWNTQITGNHTLRGTPFKINWFGSFTILDNYIPNLRRAYYNQNTSVANAPYLLLLSNTLSQKSGNMFFQNLNDYHYSGGGDISYTYNAFGKKQTVKAGYLLQIKDRLFDAKPFSIYLPRDNQALRQLPIGSVFAPQNFGDASISSTQFAFDAIRGNQFRYLANTILNAGFVQFDNQFTDKIRVVWGVRVEDFDQLVGSTKKSDPRYNYSRVTDFLPGLNATYKVNNLTNLRFSASQTVVRPEFRELASLNYYDFELNAGVQGSPGLVRTKISNFDLRYEVYPRAGEAVTFGVFYKYFDKPIESFFNQGTGGSSQFGFFNPNNATAFGAEFEFRKKLDFISSQLENFTFTSNVSYIYSRVKLADNLQNAERPLQGQSPYLLNFSLLYDLPKKGITATLLFNQIGRRIAFVGDLAAAGQTALAPNIYEAPRPLLDLNVSKKIIKNKGEIKLNVQDILNRTLFFYQNPDDNLNFDKQADPIRFSRRFGTTFNISFGYTL